MVLNSKKYTVKLSIVIIGLITISCVITLFFVFGRGHGSGTGNARDVLIPQIGDNVSDVQAHQQKPTEQGTIQKSGDQISNNADDFYRVIIENNIFRPLNWKPTQQAPTYTLLGTSTSTDGDNATAYITERKTDQFYTVTVGEKIGNATVTDIQPRQVTLDKDGKTLNLYMAAAPFLSRTRNSGSITYRPSQQQIISKSSNPQFTQPFTAKEKDRQAWRDAQKKRIAELRKMAEKLQTVSEQERRKMQEYIEQR